MVKLYITAKVQGDGATYIDHPAFPMDNFDLWQLAREMLCFRRKKLVNCRFCIKR